MHPRKPRRLASYMDAILPSNDSFYAWDGTNSDIARQLYFRSKAGDSAAPFDNFNVPPLVKERLDSLRLDWDSLSGIAQRALLWDSGFGISPDDEPVQMWTLNGHSMTDLAVPYEQFLAVGCEEHLCTQPDKTLSLSNQQCTGAQMLKAARCVVQDFEDDSNPNAAMWVTGGNEKVVPTPRVRKHTWKDSDDHNSYTVFAIHTIDLVYEPAWNECATADQNDGYGSLVLPCYTTANISSAIEAERETAGGSDWVSRWLVEDYGTATSAGSSKTSSTAFNLVLLVPIIAGVVVILALVVVGVLFKRGRQHRHASTPAEESQTTPIALYAACSDADNSTQGGPTTEIIDSTENASSRFGSDGFNRTYPLTNVSAESTPTLKTLLTSEHLSGKRIPYQALRFERALSKGINEEVWLGEYSGQQVAIKRLLQARDNRAEEVEEFSKEIELSASLVHPNIVTFVGVAWNTLNNLVMVLEFFPVGDLQGYLAKNADLLTWAQDKINVAVGVGRAVQYLHLQSPPLIHRDLKSKNIMLTRKLEPKLIDFGASRERQEYSMTAGVGTPYWTAPEVLEGKRYTEQADIYSFGVVLSELDTGKPPYADALTPEGKKPKPFQILSNVMAGMLRPRFSDDCPQGIRRIGVACCQHDPARRPTAAQVVRMLENAE